MTEKPGRCQASTDLVLFRHDRGISMTVLMFDGAKQQIWVAVIERKHQKGEYGPLAGLGLNPCCCGTRGIEREGAADRAFGVNTGRLTIPVQMSDKVRRIGARYCLKDHPLAIGEATRNSRR